MCFPCYVEGVQVKQDSGHSGHLFQVEYSGKDDTSNLNQMVFPRPDLLLASNCFAPQIDHGKGSLQPERCTWSTSCCDVSN